MNRFLWRAISLVTAAGGAFLIGTGRGSLSGAILLLVVALAASGVLFGAGRHDPDSEGALDLSARLGLGLLGGMLGGVTVVVVGRALLLLGLTGAMYPALAPAWIQADLLGVMGGATIWGLVLGILYPHMPGTTGSARGTLFGVVPSLYVLFGVDPGLLTFVFVIGLTLLWGAVAGATIGWGETAEEAPVAGSIDR